MRLNINGFIFCTKNEKKLKIMNSIKGLVSFFTSKDPFMLSLIYIYKVTNLDRVYFSALVVLQRQLEKSI